MKQYQDVTMTGQVDQYLFGIGQHFEVYERFGAHLTEKDGMEGVCFSVWAPAAKSVSVVGTFNGWREAAGCMERLGASGIYELFVPSVLGVVWLLVIISLRHPYDLTYFYLNFLKHLAL